MTEFLDNDHPIDVAVVPRIHDLGDQFEVRRALPSRQRRMVGPYVFLDQMGPHVFKAGDGLDVRPHPHIGLSTVTYLFDGEILHHDSLGSLQAIQPGDVNWMTAGSGIVHSERTAAPMRQTGSSLFGMQCWVALPEANEEDAPSFLHIGKSALPVEEGEGVSARIIAGCFLGHRSPVPIASDLFQADVTLAPGASMQMPAEYPEQAIYIAQGVLDIDRREQYDAGQLLVLKPGRRITLTAAGPAPARLMLLGGAPMDSSRYLSWNFVSSSAERIEQAKEDWRQRRFPEVPGEQDFISLPDIPGKPVRYP